MVRTILHARLTDSNDFSRVLLINGIVYEEQLAPGDVVVAVDGISTAGLSLRAVQELLDTTRRPLTIYFGKRVFD